MDTSFLAPTPKCACPPRKHHPGVPGGEDSREGRGGLALLCPSLTLGSAWEPQGAPFCRGCLRDNAQDIRDAHCGQLLLGSQMQPLPDGGTDPGLSGGPALRLVFQGPGLTISHPHRLDARGEETVILNRIMVSTRDHSEGTSRAWASGDVSLCHRIRLVQ